MRICTMPTVLIWRYIHVQLKFLLQYIVFSKPSTIWLRNKDYLSENKKKKKNLEMQRYFKIPFTLFNYSKSEHERKIMGRISQWYNEYRGLFRLGKVTRTLSWKFTPSNVQVKNKWRYTSTPPYSLIVCPRTPLLYHQSVWCLRIFKRRFKVAVSAAMHDGTNVTFRREWFRWRNKKLWKLILEKWNEVTIDYQGGRKD